MNVTSLDPTPHAASPTDVAREIRAVDWDFVQAPRSGGVHAVHGYPAKFIPEIPRALIRLLTRPGDLVLDPFCGGGTTGVEAVQNGRNFVGLDANAFAVLLTQVKLTQLPTSARAELEAHVERLLREGIRTSPDAWKPSIPNLEKWYSARVFDELTSLREVLVNLVTSEARDVALLAFASAAAKVSHQESETRYVSKPRAQEPDVARSTYVRELKRMLTVLEGARPPVDFCVRQGDAKKPETYSHVAPESVSAAITSPPYPNAYDYHLYHRFRLFWLGVGPHQLRHAEIGSHLKNQSSKAPTADYLNDMAEMFMQVRRVLKPGGYYALVVGDGLHKGLVFETATELARTASDCGFSTVASVSRQLPTHRRSVTSAGRRLAHEDILVVRKGGG